ncbi:MAG: hypothetical protein OER56_02935 [Hyphomicrobiales bacterium]|nr:hypothetical protein [Hyphomicrobiales bacterium]
MALFARLTVLACLGLVVSTETANADQIDGSWCSLAGERMTIEGSRVITPSGKTVEGNYSRHHFSYVVPEGNALAGARISAKQINDENVMVEVFGNAQQTPDSISVWKRCKLVS